MSISLNEKIKAQDKRNLVFIRFSKERSFRVLKIYLLLAVPLGSILYVIWKAIAFGLPASNAEGGFGVINMMGNTVYTLGTVIVLAYLYLGIPLLLTAAWLSYRTYKRGLFTSFEAVAVSVLVTLACAGGAILVYTGSFSQSYQELQTHWVVLLPVLIVSVIAVMLCRLVVWIYDVN